MWTGKKDGAVREVGREPGKASAIGTQLRRRQWSRGFNLK